MVRSNICNTFESRGVAVNQRSFNQRSFSPGNSVSFFFFFLLFFFFFVVALRAYIFDTHTRGRIKILV